MTGVVRPAEPRDVARLEDIENAADALLVDFLRPDHWDSAPTGDSRMESTGFVLVASESTGGDAVGFVHVIEADGHAHLEQLSVLPDHARRGFGRALVEAAKTEASRRGYDRMTLRTYADVPWNAPFYATCGFVETEPESDFHRRMVAEEECLGLGEHGRRIQMTARFKRPTNGDD
jgi:GNAT superfamily N-acetyltransferase